MAVAVEELPQPDGPESGRHDDGRGEDESVETLRELVANLRRALQSRDTIGMAKGILMARRRIGPEAAFELLVVASQHDRRGRKVAVIAEEVVVTGELPMGADAPH